MGIDLNDLMSLICGFEYYFNGLFEIFDSKMNKNRPEYSLLEKSFILNGKFVFHSANDIRKSLELSLKCLDNDKDKTELLNLVIKNFDVNDAICKPYFEKLYNYTLSQLKRLKNK